MNKHRRVVPVLLFVSILLAGCAGHRAFSDAQDLSQKQRYDAAVRKYQEAVKLEPEKQEYRLALLAAKSRAALWHLEQGQTFLEEGSYPQAAVEFAIAGELDPGLGAAQAGRIRAEELLRARGLIAEAERFMSSQRLSQARNNLDQALLLDPGNSRAQALLKDLRRERKPLLDGIELDVASSEPISLTFREAGTREVFDILGRLSGINFIFDEDVRSGTVSVKLEEATFAQTLELLLKLTGLEKKVLNSRTIILYPKTREKEKQYDDLLIQTFYLSNIDAKKAVNLLRTMLQLRKIYVHEELNALVVRDTPETIELARKILEATDRADAEVLFDLELLAVRHGDDLNLGPRLSTYSVSAGLGPRPDASNLVSDGLEAGGSTDNLVRSFSSLESFYTLPTATFEFAKTLTDSEILAAPKIRVRNKDKAKVHIGTREPVITVTINGDNRSDNVQYVDVGVKLDVEPTIQLDNTVVTKLNVEVSSVVDRQTTSSGTQVLTINTTNAQTALTLKDGEQTILAGLIRDDSSLTRNTVPFLGELPLIGSLLTSHRRNKQKTEILLSITPHILQNLELPRSDVASIWSGGEDDLRTSPSLGVFTSDYLPDAERIPVPPAPGRESPGRPLPAPEPAPGAEQGEDVAPPPAGGEAPVPSDGPARLPSGSLPVSEDSADRSGTRGEEGVPLGEVRTEAVPTAASAAVLLSGPRRVTAGEEFVLTVSVAEVEALTSAPLSITFDPRVLEFVGAREGGFLRQGEVPTLFTASPEPGAGRLLVGYRQSQGGRGASGSGPLAQVVFRALEPGQATVGLDRVDFRGRAGEPMAVDAAGTSVEVR